MKWIPIDKAKVKFGQQYLIAAKSEGGSGVHLGRLDKSETTQEGIKHTFVIDLDMKVTATHIAIITDPNKEEE